ncbi:MAG: Rpn family recombination-promoting nuclease/putative transposase [Thomasclavelia sp.]
MVKRIDKIYDFKNDFMFKHSLGNDQDPDSFYLLKLFIEGILNISCKSITILNPDLVVENIEDKDMLLDIRVQTNTGDYVNIEMQYSAFSKNQYQRFQIYGASLLSRQEKERDDYQENINHVYQIIFIDDIDKANLKLYDRYESRNEEGKLEKYNLLTRVYVQMPYINLIKKQKKLEEFSEIEKGIYIFENGITDDIIRLKEDNKVVEIMKEKIERFNQDEQLRDMAYKRSLNRWANERDKQDMYEKGKEEGIVEGIKQGIEQGLEMGIEQGVMQGIIEKSKEIIKQLFNKYYPEEDDSILENLNNEQYDKIFEMILDNRSINEIKRIFKIVRLKEVGKN